MSHYVATRSFDYCNGSEKQKKLIQSELDNFATYNGDGQCGLDKPIQWTSREFECFEDAQEWLENHEGFYWQGAAKYKLYEKKSNSKAERLQKKIDDVSKKMVKVKADLVDYVNKNDVKNRKSAFVGCPKCGSKLNKGYVPLLSYSQPCPLCHTDLFSDTVKNRIKAYRSQIDDFDKQIGKIKKEMETAKQTGKFVWRWAVKFEFHC